MKGGKLLAEGGYGCIFLPGVNCNGSSMKSKKYISKMYNAGSICIGKFSPMAVTDYNVGSNHTLPTLGSAKFSSGLSLSEFYKKISYINLSKKGVEKIGESAIHLANYENLTAHILSIRSRMRRK